MNWGPDPLTRSVGEGSDSDRHSGRDLPGKSWRGSDVADYWLRLNIRAIIDGSRS